MKSLLSVCECCGTVAESVDHARDTTHSKCMFCNSDELMIAPTIWFVDAYNRGQVKPWTACWLEENDSSL